MSTRKPFQDMRADFAKDCLDKRIQLAVIFKIMFELEILLLSITCALVTSVCSVLYDATLFYQLLIILLSSNFESDSCFLTSES